MIQWTLVRAKSYLCWSLLSACLVNVASGQQTIPRQTVSQVGAVQAIFKTPAGAGLAGVSVSLRQTGGGAPVTATTAGDGVV